ncbi:DUF4184 family protein [Streptomyces sp. NPDC097619]|uniref:DUF4184 family protein n=1 Tax=Streptomyces sp. NPDC097619 TaxID=3157228 RepID=UPI00331E9C0F
MPFTLSHAAAVLPGIRRTGRGRGPLVASALVAGSFAPDLTYFAASVVPGAMSFGVFTHSLLGVVTVDALFTALLVAVWLLLREPLVGLLPAARRGPVYAAARGEDWRGRSPVALALRFYPCAVVGSLTHVVWDSFTHHDRWGTDAFPVLNRTVAGEPLYFHLQYGGSALALLVLGRFLYGAVRLRRGTPPPEPDGTGVGAVPPAAGRAERLLCLGLLAVGAVLGAVQRLLLWLSYDPPVSGPLDAVPALCFGAGCGLGAALLVFAAVVRVRHARRVARERRRSPAFAGRS